MNTAVIFPGYNKCVGDLEHAPFKLLASIPELGRLIHLYRGSLNTDLHHNGLRHCCIGTSPAKSGYTLDYLVKSFSYLRRHRISLIYCFDADMAFLLRRAAKFHGIPIVLQVGVDWAAYNRQIPSPWKRAIKDHIKRQSLRDAAAVIALAHHLKAPIEAYGKSPEVLYPFIETESYPVQYTKRGNRLQLLFIGRLAPVKGARYLVDSLPLVLKQRSDFHLQIVGGSLPGRRSDEPYIRSRIDEYGLHDHVSLVGQVPHSRVVEYLKGADLVIMPSETEGFHYALLEAWSCGVPVLATDIPFHREIIDGSVGRLCTFSPESMAGGILEFLSMDEERLLGMRHAARKKVENMNMASREAWREFFRNRVPDLFRGDRP